MGVGLRYGFGVIGREEGPNADWPAALPSGGLGNQKSVPTTALFLRCSLLRVGNGSCSR